MDGVDYTDYTNGNHVDRKRSLEEKIRVPCCFKTLFVVIAPRQARTGLQLFGEGCLIQRCQMAPSRTSQAPRPYSELHTV